MILFSKRFTVKKMMGAPAKVKQGHSQHIHQMEIKTGARPCHLKVSLTFGGALTGKLVRGCRACALANYRD